MLAPFLRLASPLPSVMQGQHDAKLNLSSLLSQPIVHYSFPILLRVGNRVGLMAGYKPSWYNHKWSHISVLTRLCSKDRQHLCWVQNAVTTRPKHQTALLSWTSQEGCNWHLISSAAAAVLLSYYGPNLTNCIKTQKASVVLQQITISINLTKCHCLLNTAFNNTTVI